MEHDFAPTAFYNTIGSHPVALEIESGDTVRTELLDSAGRDATLTERASRGNPVTGPFFVVGAEVGDTLAVTFDSAEPNRDSGWSRLSLAPVVLEPDQSPAIAARQPYLRDQIGTWRIDREKQVVVLADPAVVTTRDVVVPLAPMLGCVAVAPDRGQMISTATSGPHGGNMDYRGIRTGTTVYFPVFVAGGLLQIGDGHAVQGHGEISGSGVETSFDVQFSVEVISGHGGRWPRGEDPGYYFTLGNARPLDQALQHATTEMLWWLMDWFGLPEVEAHVLMSQQVEYEIGNVFDPAYTVVCKMPRWVVDDYATDSSPAAASSGPGSRP